MWKGYCDVRLTKSSTYFSMHDTDNIAVAVATTKPLDVDKPLFTVLLMVVSSFVAVYDGENGRSRRDSNGCGLHGHGEGKYYSCHVDLTQA